VDTIMLTAGISAAAAVLGSAVGAIGSALPSFLNDKRTRSQAARAEMLRASTEVISAAVAWKAANYASAFSATDAEKELANDNLLLATSGFGHHVQGETAWLFNLVSFAHGAMRHDPTLTPEAVSSIATLLPSYYNGTVDIQACKRIVRGFVERAEASGYTGVLPV
jgi:hypothetical protein